MTRFSERNLGSWAAIESSRSIVRAKGRPLFRATKRSLRGSSFVATSAPKRFAGMRRPRPLMHGVAHAIVSPKTFCRPKTDPKPAGNVRDNFTGMLRSAGPINLFLDGEIFALIKRYILGPN